ncbi:MAG: hypothetical protein IPM27_06260 [Nitrosomonadales bacterium]|nr:hypothetical protein [Nitrosomonadales bacterium]
MATITGQDWVEQNGFQLQMWDVPKLGRIVLFKPASGAGYWDGYIAAKRYVAQFDPEIFLGARKLADTANWVESHKIADEAIASYQRKLESADCGSCWDCCPPSKLSDEDDEVSAELLEEYWAAVDECESNRECGSTDGDEDTLEERVGTAMQIPDSPIDEEPQDDEPFGIESQLISIDITGDQARIDEEVRTMNQGFRAAYGAEVEGRSTNPKKHGGNRLARIQIQRVRGEINLSICL